MFEIDKKEFGAFMAQLRKEKGMTQKELAERLYISDKAVSKWETGVSIPDVSLLLPLSEQLDVTVTELLQSRRLNADEAMDPEEAEALLQKAIQMSSARQPAQKESRVLLVGAYVLSVLISGLELLWLSGILEMKADLYLLPVMCMGIGAYFWLFVRSRLPWYYDHDRIGTYHHGGLRMNVPGVAFNNRNWPYIVRAIRIYTAAAMVGYPILYWIGSRFLASVWFGMGEKVLVGLAAASLVGTLYYVGKKYE